MGQKKGIQKFEISFAFEIRHALMAPFFCRVLHLKYILYALRER